MKAARARMGPKCSRPCWRQGFDVDAADEEGATALIRALSVDEDRDAVTRIVPVLARRRR